MPVPVRVALVLRLNVLVGLESEIGRKMATVEGCGKMHKLAIITAVFLSTNLISSVSIAQEAMQLCLRYNATGQKYLVNAALWRGGDLNRSVGISRYNSQAIYAVVFWAQDQATIIQLSYNVRPSTTGIGGTDQTGASWHVSQATSSCLHTR